MGNKWTKEVIDWVLKNYSKEKKEDVTKRFCNKFGHITSSGLCQGYKKFANQKIAEVKG